MKIADTVGLIVLAIVVVALLGWLAYWSLGRRAGINRSEMIRLQKDRTLLSDALLEVENAADEYREIDSPLCTKIREILRETRKARHIL